MKQLTKTSLAALFVILTAAFSSAYAQSACCDKHGSMAKTEMSVDTKAAKKTSDKQAVDIVRKGTINVKAIDKNKDGKVFQCPMDWNVISDKVGKCPSCKMELKEVANKLAEDNLVKHGFKIKK